MLQNIRFEHIMAFGLMVIISIALGYSMYIQDRELIVTFGGVLTAAFSGIVGFFFTKHNPGSDNGQTPAAAKKKDGE